MSYEGQRAKAYTAIKRKGQAMTLKRSVGGEYDPTTCRTAPPMVMEHDCYGLMEEYNIQSGGFGADDGTLILAGDKKLTLTAAADFPEPQTGDALHVADTVYSVVRCKPLAPGGVAILYEVQARK